MGEQVILLIIAIGALFTIAILVGRRLIRRVIVYEFQQGIIYRNGQIARVVLAGTYFMPARNTDVTIIDTRTQTLIVGGQEVITADTVSVKVSLVAMYAIADARQAVLATFSYHEELYLALQLALRNTIATRALTDLPAQRATIGSEILTAVTPAAERLGLKLTLVELRDIVLPADLRRAFAQVAIARQEGLAALERARGEQAALANAARMLEQNPYLFHLRALQAIGERGNMIIHTGAIPHNVDSQTISYNQT